MSDSEDDFHSADEGDDEILAGHAVAKSQQEGPEDETLPPHDCERHEPSVSPSTDIPPLVQENISEKKAVEATHANDCNDGVAKILVEQISSSSETEVPKEGVSEDTAIVSGLENSLNSIVNEENYTAEGSGDLDSEKVDIGEHQLNVGSGSLPDMVTRTDKEVTGRPNEQDVETTDEVTDSETEKKESVDKQTHGDGKACFAVTLDKEHSEEEEKDDNSNEITDWDNDDWGWEASLESAVESAASAMSSALHTFESRLGIPDPAYMAKVVTEEEKTEQQTKEVVSQGASQNCESGKKKTEEYKDQQSQGSSWFSSGWGNWGVSGLSEMVQSAGKDIVTGSLDTLEYLGKKTMHVISEQDPGLRSKTESVVRPFLNKKPTLSEVLREAKQNQGNSTCNEFQTVEKTLSFRDLFEEFEGFTHLEALEMLSNECEQKLQRILKVQSHEALQDTKETLLLIRNSLEPAEEPDEPQKPSPDLPDDIKSAVKELSLAVKTDKLIDAYCRAMALSSVNSGEEFAAKLYYEQALSSLIEVTCRSLELIHKVSELLLLPDFSLSVSIISRAEQVKQIFRLLRSACTSLSSSFAERLHEMGNESSTDFPIAGKITELHLEGSNCASYVDDGQRLLLPILQLAAVK